MSRACGNEIHLDVDALQVDQHPREDLRLRRARPQVRVVPHRALAGVPAQQLQAAVFGEQRAAVKGVDDQVVDPVPRRIGQRTRKWPGKLTPSTVMPARRATSM